jgi:hypothetical protein
MKGYAMRRATFFAFCAILLTLTGCQGAFDPFQRPGNWSATGAANETIAQQVAVPSDLISGRGNPNANGVAATAALDKALGPNGTGTAAGLQMPAQNAVQTSSGSSTGSAP